MTSTENSVGIGPLADEPKPSQHPIRGEGGELWTEDKDREVRWADYERGWQHCEESKAGPLRAMVMELVEFFERVDGTEQHRDLIQRASALYAAPTTYGKGEELLASVVTAWERLSGDQPSWRVEEWLADDMKPAIDAIRQALQSISGRTG